MLSNKNTKNANFLFIADILAASWKSSSVADTLSRNPSKCRRLRDHPSFSFFISSWMFS